MHSQHYTFSLPKAKTKVHLGWRAQHLNTTLLDAAVPPDCATAHKELGFSVLLTLHPLILAIPLIHRRTEASLHKEKACLQSQPTGGKILARMQPSANSLASAQVEPHAANMATKSLALIMAFLFSSFPVKQNFCIQKMFFIEQPQTDSTDSTSAYFTGIWNCPLQTTLKNLYP